MKTETLNYECRLYDDTDIVDEFEFYGDSLDMAKDHVRHVLFAKSGYKLAEFKSLTASNWRSIKKTDYRR